MVTRGSYEMARAPWTSMRHVVWAVVALILVLGGAAVGLGAVPGSTEGETFTCGSPFSYDNSGDYAGTGGFAACDHIRRSRQPLAIGAIGLGLGVGAFALWAGRERTRDPVSSPAATNVDG